MDSGYYLVIDDYIATLDINLILLEYYNKSITSQLLRLVQNKL